MNDVLNRIKAHTKPYQGAEVVKEIFGEHYSAAKNGSIPVVLFCAGSSGKILCPFFMRHDVRPVCFCDNDTSRIGNSFCGLPIISIAELKRDHRNSLIVLATAGYHKTIQKQLVDNGFSEDKIVSLDTDDHTFDSTIRRERILMLAKNGEPNALLKELESDEGKLLDAYTVLEDNKSKEIFIRRMALVASGFDYQSYQAYLKDFSEPILQSGYNNPERFNRSGSYYYFNNDVLQLKANEILVDGGAYTGDSTDEFIAACEKKGVHYQHIYCLEPDHSNYEKLLKNTQNYKNVTCLPYGLWSHRTTLNFVSSAQTEAYGARIQETGVMASGAADVKIETASIDEQFNGENVTLIKMDIEGAEFNAIQGAADTIKKKLPNLAISIYHKNNDIYEIPLLVHHIHPGYKIYIRHLGNYFDDTILFATL
ncbi:MAG: FkbM family methyltransferase [Desulfatitalea sp.]|nr:FkbM family methyltransferase [Desulfatitalea sp.]